MRTKAEENFIDQYTRTLLVQWANYSVTSGLPPENETGARLDLGMVDTTAPQQPRGFLRTPSIYVLHAQEKGWLSKKEPLTVLAKGYDTAAAFLRR